MNLRSLTWKLNWYRQSELEGALLLGKMIRTALLLRSFENKLMRC